MKRRSQAGFTLVELLMVLLIMGVIGAVSLPSVIQFFRSGRLRGATRELQTELQTARTKAISKNVNRGVVVVALSDRTYRWIIEDDLDPQDGQPVFGQPLATIANVPGQAGPVRTLPEGITFRLAGTNAGFRFNRLGQALQPGVGANNPVLGLGVNVVDFSGAEGAIVLEQLSQGLTSTVRVAPGGRVQVN